jgi:two-component system sensor kinase FixL
MELSRSAAAPHTPVIRPTNAGACLISVDASGDVRRWTRDAEIMFGYPSEQADRLTLEQLAPFLRERSQGLEGWCRRVDGSVFRGLVATLSESDDEVVDEPISVLVITDITSRYMREQALLRVRERGDDVTTSVAHLTFFSIDYLHDDVNIWGAFAGALGWTEAAPPRRLSELLELVHSEDRAALRASLDHAITTGEAFEVELRVCGDFGERWLLIAGSVVDGQPPRIVGAGMNITRRRGLEEALRTSEAKLQALLDATIDGIMTIDADGAIESLNHTAINMLRCPDRTYLGTPWRGVLDLTVDALPSSGTLQEALGRRFDGSTFTMECGFSEIGVGPQRLSIVVMRDVTQRRLLERQVLDVSEQLQRQIGQDLHDGLGQLLTGTAFLTKGLQHSLASEHQPQAQRIVELINLAIARVRSLARGLSPIHVEAQNLEAVLRHTVSEASELLGVACVLSLHDFVDTAQPAAIAQLCLIAREAITNAVRHGQAQHIVVRLSRQGDQSTLSVEDDGVGIDTADKPLDGLGLRSMRYRAKMIGGRLEVIRTRSGTTVRCSWRDF